ncbi:MAG: molybdate ABC transporter permease subunit [Verrucomicrobia bacterium]|nr:molybdate ABC transporter permease subunit [Verrucomicrobiota bacterium]
MNAELWHITWFTAAMAGLGTLLVVPPGLACAWLLARRDWPGKALCETLIALPLVLPPVATGLILLRVFSRRGSLGQWLESVGLDVVFTWRGVVIATAVMSLPLFVRAARIALEGVNPHLESVARTLGAGGWRVFWSVTLPLARRGLLAAAILAFARGLGEFGATVMLAGYIPGRTVTLSLSIYQFVQLGRDDEALILLALSLALAFAALLAGEWLLRPTSRPLRLFR